MIEAENKIELTNKYDTPMPEGKTDVSNMQYDGNKDILLNNEPTESLPPNTASISFNADMWGMIGTGLLMLKFMYDIKKMEQNL
jgi:hypothetical protein